MRAFVARLCREFGDWLRKLRAIRPLQKVNLVLAGALILFMPAANPVLNDRFPPGDKPLREAVIDLPVETVIVSGGQAAPALTAGGIYLTELTTDSLLYAKNADRQFYPASTTKIVSAAVALREWGLDQTIDIKPVFAEGQVLGVHTGEQYRLEDLLYGLLLQSGNDAAVNLAVNFPGGYEEFVRRMNQMAFDYRLGNTHFTNPSGLDDYQHYTSPHDMNILTRAALGNSTFAAIVATRQYELYDRTGAHRIPLENINALLGKIEGVKGVKTGWTELAGECLVTLVEKNGLRMVGVVFQSHDRFNDTERLFAWGLENFRAAASPRSAPE